MKHASMFFSIGLILLLLSGCGPKDPRAVNLVPGQGKVTLDGQPLDGATIVLTPVSGGKFNIGAASLSKEDGTFELTTFLAGDGVHPDTYQVTIFKDETVSVLSPEEIRKLESAGRSSPEPVIKNLIPERYNRAETSGFVIEIPEKGKKDILFDLVTP